jgi:low temperature requirement protein LtrA
VRSYILTLLVAQAFWVAIIFLELPIAQTFAVMTVPFLIELLGPYLAEGRGEGTPWHPHHIAERYGLFVIIALGEGVVGTVASLSAIVQEAGWSVDAALVAVAGIGLTFGLWWSYFLMPSGRLLHEDPGRSFFWGYGHMVLFAAIAATGAGLHVAAYDIEHKAHISATATVLAVAVPVALFVVSKFVIFARLAGVPLRAFGGYLLTAFTLIGAAVGLASLGVPMTYCLVVLTLAPAALVSVYELTGHAAVARLMAKEAQTLH